MREFSAEALGAGLVQAGLIEPAALGRATQVSVETGERLDRVLLRLGFVAERPLTDLMARLLDLPLAGPEDYPTTPVLPELLAPRFLRATGVLPLALDATGLDVAMIDPLDLYGRRAIELACGHAVRPRFAVPAELEAALTRLYRAEAEATGAETGRDAADFNETDVERLRDLASEAPVVRLVNQTITRAVDQGASDIHIEPFESQLRLRFRIDGVLIEQEGLSRRQAAAIVSRVKLMAGLDIAERRLPQDGRIKLAVRGKDIDLRVATSPTLHGESVVLRILDWSGTVLEFGQLGLGGRALEDFLRLLDRPNGIILVTGPTGSGKTTTLYTALSRLNQPSRKVVTVEDPVEYQIHGINQVQVKPEIGLDFATVLRATLRHDPDVLMIGEIRDLETAQIAIQASLTGHLVLSTIHTNSAAATITRLIDLGVPDYLIASTLTVVVAQRLVRVLCVKCREAYELLPEIAAETGLAALSGKKRPTLHRAIGCQACRGTGYKGRVGVFEVMVVDDKARRRIVARDGEISPDGRYTTLHQDGLAKALEGVTSLEEVWRTTAER